MKLNEEEKMKYKTFITTNKEKFIQAGKRYYHKLNSRPLKIYYTTQRNPYFKWKNKRKHLNNFVKAHNNPWTGNLNLPDFIHGYWTTFYIEIINNETINLYELYEEIELEKLEPPKPRKE